VVCGVVDETRALLQLPLKGLGHDLTLLVRRCR
jgi:hypothetical protein